MRWPGAKPRRFKEVSDGLSNTILAVELGGAGIPWMEPRDLAFDELTGPEGRDPEQNPLGVHRGEPGWFVDREGGRATNVAMGDGSVRAIPWNAPGDSLAALLTIDGGENVDVDNVPWPPDETRVRIQWPRVLSLTVLLVSTVLFYLSVHPRPREPAQAA